MLRSPIAGMLAMALSLPLVGRAQSPDLSGTWFEVDPNGGDDSPVTCVPIQDMAHLVAINNGVNPMHIYTDSSGRATRIEAGDGPLATGFARTAAACVADFMEKQAEFMRQSNTVTVEPDAGN